jgi:hypothetical protein
MYETTFSVTKIENDFAQQQGAESIQVIGHCKLSLVNDVEHALLLESGDRKHSSLSYLDNMID